MGILKSPRLFISVKYAIISDIHSNLEAFEAVLERIDSLGIKDIICLGDIVGYNANPNECIEIIKARNIISVVGNHDSRAAGLEEPFNFNSLAREAICWTRNKLANENLLFLKNLPKKISFDNDKSIAIHGFINDTDRYILSLADANENFRLMNDEPYRPKVCFFGHTHMPKAYKYEDYKAFVIEEKEMALDENSVYLINPGAVGQSRDGNPMASFLIYDTDENKVNFFRVEYDIMKCCEKIINAGLPEKLAQRLIIGC